MCFCSPLNAVWRFGLTLPKAWSALASKSLATGAGRGKLGAIPESENEDVFLDITPQEGISLYMILSACMYIIVYL